MECREISIELRVQGPVLTRSTAPGAPGVDAPFARDPNGHPILPSTHIKGKIREAWGEIHEIAPGVLGLDCEDWLGARNEERSWEPSRGRLVLSDFTLSTPPSLPKGRRHRISIDDEMGAVRPNHLQVVETLHAPGEPVTFSGTAAFVPQDEGEAKAVRRCLDRCLRWVSGVGGLRTVGFGQVLGVEVGEVEVKADPARAAEADAKLSGPLLDLEIEPLGPFLVTAPQSVANLYESRKSLPGNVLKGALASTWNERLGRSLSEPIGEGADSARQALARNFEKLRFTHAFPGEDGRRPVELPLSLVKVPQEDGTGYEPRYDVAFVDGPVLLRASGPEGWAAPTFRVDWKKSEGEEKAFGWPSLHRELTVRTAMDPATRRAADEKLFAHETIVPSPGDCWLGRVDLSRVPPDEQQEVADQLADLLAGGLRHVGKTHAAARARLLPAGERPCAVPAYAEDTGRRHVLTLQTAALLLDPRKVAEPGIDLRKAYAEVWNEWTEDLLELKRCFTHHRLAGGTYLHHRFQPGKAYEPYLLTAPGSVFVFEAKEGREKDAKRWLTERQDRGLELPGWAVERYARTDLDPPVQGSHWRACPYIPENGYGEVVVDLEIHWQREPGEDEQRAVYPSEVSHVD